MVKIIHLEDEEEYREKVKRCLAETLGLDFELLQSSDLESFYRLEEHTGDLYISDRHFPPKPGDKPDDNSWRTLAGFVKEVSVIYPNRGMILLTGKPPEEIDWRRYKSIKAVVPKSKFNSKEFGELIRSLLGV